MSAFSDMRPEAVLFDCDGVLVDSEPIADRVLADYFARHGLPIEVEVIHTLFAGGTMRGAGEEAMRMGASLPPNWLDQIYETLYAKLAQGTPIIPAIPELLDTLDAAGILYAVGSNGAIEKMEITLGQNGLFDRFRGRLVSSHVLGRAKPDPGVYLEAARLLGADIRNCVVIDDSPSGVRAGIASGARTLGYAARSDARQLRELGAEVFCDMEEVPGMLGI